MERTLVTRDNTEFNSEEFTFSVDGRAVFSADKYNGGPEGGFASVFWKMGGDFDLCRVLGQLEAFHSAITADARLKPASSKHIGIWLMNGECPRVDYPLYEDGCLSLVSRFGDTEPSLLRVCHPYADFGIEGLGSMPLWSERHKRLGVIGHQDLSEHVAHLMRATGVIVPEAVLAHALRSVYDFR